jgi:hypothetical protein
VVAIAELVRGNHEQVARAQVYSSHVSKTEISPWLEITRWPRYFNGPAVRLSLATALAHDTAGYCLHRTPVNPTPGYTNATR